MIDELTPIARYIALEMTVNARCEITQRIRLFNSTDGEACIHDYFRGSMWRQMFAMPPEACAQMVASHRSGALVMWTLQVMENGPWDHKPLIRAKFASSVDAERKWHRYGDQRYFFDVWSNLHYGYVGIAAGFSESMLLDGAGIEQIGSNVLHRRWPLRAAGVRGLRAFDDPWDRVAITKGIELRARFPHHVPEGIVMDAVRNTPGIALIEALPKTTSTTAGAR